MQTVSTYMPTSSQIMFRLAAEFSAGTVKKTGVTSYWSIPAGITFTVGEDWGLSASVFYNFPLGSVNMKSFRDRLNPNQAQTFPDKSYVSKTGGAGFHVALFFGE